MSTGVLLVDTDPDTLLKRYTESILYCGLNNQNAYCLPASVINCLGRKRYITSLDYDITYPFLLLISGDSPKSAPVLNLEELFNLKLTNNCSIKTSFGFISVEYNAINITLILEKLYVVSDFTTIYQYYVMILELLSSINGLQIGTVSLFVNNSFLSQCEHNIQDVLQPQKFYKTNHLTCANYNHFISCCDFVKRLLCGDSDYNLNDITDVGWRDLTTCLLLVQNKISNTNDTSGILSVGSYEQLWYTDLFLRSTK